MRQISRRKFFEVSSLVGVGTIALGSLSVQNIKSY